MPKEKLTLSVDKDVIDKAKSIGLNLSEITEMTLKSFSFTAKEKDKEALYKSYQSFFNTMKALLKTYDTTITIAHEEVLDDNDREIGEDETVLCCDGTFYSQLYNASFTDITKIPSNAFLSTKEILSNLINGLVIAAKRREETLIELEMAKRIVEAIADTMQGKEGSNNKLVGKKNE